MESNVIPLVASRSLSGHALHGSKVVRLAYIDEAGISNPRQEPFLVVAAVLIHADRNLIEIERYLDKLVSQYIPVDFQNDFVFHAKELFNGGGPVFKRDDPRFPLSVRLKIAERIGAIPRRFGIRLAFGFVYRSDFPKSVEHPMFATLSAKNQAVTAHVTAFMIASMQIDQWMRANAPNEVCMLVVEDNQQARNLIKETHTYHQNNLGGRFADPEIAQHFPFRRIKEDPLFQQKKKSSILQVADFYAYVFKRYLMEDLRYEHFIKDSREQFAALEFERPSQKRGQK